MIKQLKNIKRDIEESVRKEIKRIKEIREEVKKKLEDVVVWEERVKEMEAKVKEINKWVIEVRDKENDMESLETGSRRNSIFSIYREKVG